MFRLKSLGASVKRQHRAAGDLEAGDVAHQWETSRNCFGCPSARYSESSDGGKYRWLGWNQARPVAGLSGGASDELKAFAAHAVLG